jgi:hypothetical protein
MGKWLLIFFVIAVGVGVWLTVDPGARITLASAWNDIRNAPGGALGGIDAASLWAPIGRAFEGFANSVAAMWSPRTIQIDVPSVQVQP